MSSNLQKFDRELKALKGFGARNPLGPKKQEQLKADLLAKIITLPQDQGNGWMNPPKRQRVMHYAFFSLLIFSFLGGTAYASGSAVRGDALYPVKRVKEKLQAAAAVSATNKAEVQAKQAQERIKELEKLKAKPVVVVPNAAAVRQKLEAEAEQEAETQVSHALETLTRVRTELQAKGNAKAVDALDKNIQKLTARAKQARIKTAVPELKKDNDGQSQQPNQAPNGEVKGEATKKPENKDAGSNPKAVDDSNAQQKPEQQRTNGRNR